MSNPKDVVASEANGSSMSSYAHVFWAVSAFSFSSIAMMSGNKLAITHFHLPATLVLFQVIGTICLLQLKRNEITPLEPRKVLMWLPCTLLFTFMLTTSLFSLKAVTISTVLIFRNGGNIINAFAEWFFLGKPVTFRVFLSLAMTVAGATVYGYTNADFSPVGLFWILANVIGQVAYGIYVKHLMVHKGEELSLSKFGMSFYNNVLCIPLLLIIIIAAGEAPRIVEVAFDVSAVGWLCVGVTCVVGYFISVSGFALQQVVSATAFMVINNANKIANILFGIFLLRDPFSGPLPVLGCVLSLTGSFWFSYEQFLLAEEEKQQKAAAAAAASAGRNASAKVDIPEDLSTHGTVRSPSGRAVRAGA
eukprot:TRINITY_DN718_c0_g2_i1.p1 TRINITY_DN718_c0_g2~~TRINITY_DN718_c0_g2_i1.p1  ORF type:complete len:363 (+),score=67.85 TRINITY_DN718_c0_g2_i1:97-1185(+)